MHPGHLINSRYRIEERLGNGGMAVVFRARDEVLDRPVALKVLAGPYARAEQARERIRIEAQSAARLWHPHVTNVYDYGEATDENGDRLPYVVMELLPGRTLARRLVEGPVPTQAALRICAEVAGALAAAHEQGLVHRDVKPSNVMLTPSGAKVMDFGIAAAAGRSEREADGRLLGTPAYLAPERLLADQVVPASDVYALGLLAYRLFAGRLPWTAETTTQMLRSNVYVQPPPIPAVRGVPMEARSTINQCLAKDPAERPPAAEAARVLATAAGLAPPPDDRIPRSAVPPGTALAGSRRIRRIAMAGAAVAAAVVAATALYDPAEPGQAARDPDNVSSASSIRGPVPGAAASAVGPAPEAQVGIGAGSADPVPPTGQDRRVPGPAGGQRGTPGATVPLRSPAATRPAAATTAPAAPRSATPVGSITTLGGVVRVDCDGATARVVDLDLAPGYEIKDYDAGPADEVQVVLLSSDNETELKATCEDGRPIPKIKESPQ